MSASNSHRQIRPNHSTRLRRSKHRPSTDRDVLSPAPGIPWCEILRATPEEGAALAVALLEEFRTKECLVLATTHHDRLKAYASSAEGVLNGSVEFDDVNLKPTYRLMVGVPGGSSGIAIARRLGLSEEIIV